jgi:hypothetical protein
VPLTAPTSLAAGFVLDVRYLDLKEVREHDALSVRFSVVRVQGFDRGEGLYGQLDLLDVARIRWVTVSSHSVAVV